MEKLTIDRGRSWVIGLRMRYSEVTQVVVQFRFELAFADNELLTLKVRLSATDAGVTCYSLDFI
jgi:hypothetical protein